MVKLLTPQTMLKERYRIVSSIGQGGMGAVYRAEDMLLPGRVCAIKEITPDPDLTAEALTQLQDQFRQEASVLARLDHPNLPKVSDYFTQEGREYLVMDFVPGYDLREKIDQALKEEHYLSESQVINWADQLCDALSYLHEQTPPILHRDIKPSNIKITPSGLIKLVDFGLVKLLTNDEARTVTVVQGRGTAAYTPLEQYGGDDVHTDIRSDVYALGATLYHLLTGRSPATAREQFLRPTSLINPRAINPHISPGVEQAILAALALHPSQRPPDVKILQKMLHEARVPSDIAPMLITVQELFHSLRSNFLLLVCTTVLITIAYVITP
ncbi:MAG: serine/threonine protein kinase [Anaerolineae bacterium]|nr:serine/threonine protein kinase [Anaerolineae bacterium]